MTEERMKKCNYSGYKNTVSVSSHRIKGENETDTGMRQTRD